MTVCTNCSRELQPEWKFCISCGTPTGVVDAAIAPVADEQDTAPKAEPAPESKAEPAPTPAPEPELAPTPAAESALAPAPEPELAPAPAPAPVPEPAPEPASPILRAEDIPEDDPEPTPAAIRPAAAADPHVNILAVLALILGCLVSPLAALFGHIALNQIGRTGERGTAIAWVAIVLGYLWLAALLVLGISYLVLNS
ncbi:MAG: DUF4190 domain-containing protein [Pseudolysinimonas sp.]